MTNPELINWLETNFRDAIHDDERVMQAIATLRVSHDRGDPPIEVVRRCIATFVIDLIDPGALDAGDRHSWLSRN